MTAESETLEVDVLLVGAGPASLACAIALKKLLDAKGVSDATLLVIEKAEQVGHHQLSGAVLDPRAIEELWPGYRDDGFPIDATVKRDALRYFTAGGSFKVSGPFLPPPLKNEGKLIVSLQKVAVWLAEKAESLGIEVYPGFAGAEILYEGDRVVGVRTGDMGRDKKGDEKPAYQPGMEIRAKVVVLGEGPRGSLTKQLMRRLRLQGTNPQTYEVGVKELWEIRSDMEGEVIHTLGWPLEASHYGGGWIYGLGGKRVSIGLVMSLDYGNPRFDPQALFNRWKTHPFLRETLSGGELVRYGAKTIPGGGYYSMPRFYGDGFVIVGDSAGFVNMRRLKGIHLALKSGMLAAEAIADAMEKDDYSAATLKGYHDRFESSWAKQELWSARNFRAAFNVGRKSGLLRSGLQMLFGGRILKDPLPLRADHEHYRLYAESSERPRVAPDDQLTFDRLKDVYFSGTQHEEDQPCHLLVIDPQICVSRCTQEYGNPCQHFCPAQVYEWHGDDGLVINASNCVHCKTCDVADPYQVINWVVPEGGGGPRYLDM